MHYVGSWPTGVGSIVHIHSLHMEHNLFETGIGKGKLRRPSELSSAALVDLTKLDGTESASVCLILTKLWRWFWSAFRVWLVKKWFWGKLPFIITYFAMFVLFCCLLLHSSQVLEGNLHIMCKNGTTIEELIEESVSGKFGCCACIAVAAEHGRPC